MNLAHSGGLDRRPYSDWSCLMGNPHYKDEGGEMCFNSAKNFQLGWYNDHRFATGVNGGTSWSGTIISISEYKNNPNSRPVVVKVESGQSTDLFVGFNRATGVNKDTADAQDQVTVTQAGSDGIGYSQSYLMAKLSQGQSFVVPNWRRTGFDLTIHVKTIDLKASPAYADIIMTFGDPRDPPTTKNPTRQPSKMPTLKPTRQPSKVSIIL